LLVIPGLSKLAASPAAELEEREMDCVISPIAKLGHSGSPGYQVESNEISFSYESPPRKQSLTAA